MTLTDADRAAIRACCVTLTNATGPDDPRADTAMDEAIYIAGMRAGMRAGLERALLICDNMVHADKCAAAIRALLD